jgi:prevent-host-death family protein
MSARVNASNARRRIGELLERVSLRHEQFVIEKNGKAMAALVSAAQLEAMRRIARRTALATLRKNRGSGLSEREADALAAEARAWARRNPPR